MDLRPPTTPQPPSPGGPILPWLVLVGLFGGALGLLFVATLVPQRGLAVAVPAAGLGALAGCVVGGMIGWVERREVRSRWLWVGAAVVTLALAGWSTLQVTSGAWAELSGAMMLLLVGLGASGMLLVVLVYTLTRRFATRSRLQVLRGLAALTFVAACFAQWEAHRAEPRDGRGGRAAQPDGAGDGWVTIPDSARADTSSRTHVDERAAGSPSEDDGGSPGVPAAEGRVEPAATRDSSASAGPVAEATPVSHDPHVTEDCMGELPPFFQSIQEGNLGEVKQMARATSVNVRCELGEGGHAYPLTLALEEGRVGIAHALLDEGADPNLRPPNSPAPLHLAIASGDLALFRRVMAAGARPEVSDANGPALLQAVRRGSPAMVRTLLEAGASPRTGFYGAMPLTEAAKAGSLEMVRALVESGAEVNPPSAMHDRPMSLAARQGHLSVVEYLLEAGSVDSGGALAAALEGGHPEVAHLLASRGASVARHYEGCRVALAVVRADDVELLRTVFAHNSRFERPCLIQMVEVAGRELGPASPVTQLLATLPTR